MRCYLVTATAICFALMVVGCQPAADQSDSAAVAAKQAEDVAAIKKLMNDVGAAVNVNADDVAALAAFFTDDAVRMPPNQPAISGKEAIRESLQNSYGNVTVKFTDEVAEIEVAGDWAFSRSAYTITLIPKASSFS